MTFAADGLDVYTDGNVFLRDFLRLPLVGNPPCTLSFANSHPEQVYQLTPMDRAPLSDAQSTIALYTVGGRPSM